MTIERFAALGGIFATLTFWHFLADWTFQSHKEAMAKAKDRKVRAWHCVKYVVAFLPLFRFIDTPTFRDPFGLASLTVLATLFISHYVIDSYVPVLLWAKHLRQAPQFTGVGVTRIWAPGDPERVTYKTTDDAFRAFASTSLGLVLMITIDQLLHIACLLPIAYLIVR